MPHLPYIIFFFALGACVGSFINVIVWRLPRGESIVSPPSHCPRCNTRLAWYDNIPIFGWIALGGKCRYCRESISIRYPIIEAITGGLFLLYYIAMFIYQEGPCAYRPMSIEQDWPIYLLYLALIAGLLPSALIDAEYYIVPIEISWMVAGLGLLVHTFIDMPLSPGSLIVTPLIGAMSAGATTGLIISLILLHRKILPQSFAEGAPLLEIEKEAQARQGSPEPAPVFTRAQLRAEMQKEILFLLPPLILGAVWMLLCWKVPPIAQGWQSLTLRNHWLAGMLGSLWGALIGGFVVWFARISGTIVFGREAMGLGDVHLMLGIGAVLGAFGAVVVFFLAPFIGLFFALYKLIFGKGREVPLVPYLSLACGVVMLFYCRLVDYFLPPMSGLIDVMRRKLLGE